VCSLQLRFNAQCGPANYILIPQENKGVVEATGVVPPGAKAKKVLLLRDSHFRVSHVDRDLAQNSAQGFGLFPTSAGLVTPDCASKVHVEGAFATNWSELESRSHSSVGTKAQK
jgi:hypothetical protein